jgi:WXG100 family type VII secretion target
MAAASMVRVNTASLNSDANQISSDIKSIKTSVTKMYDDVEILGTMWKGKANTEFTNRFTNEYEYIIKFLSSLEKFAEDLKNDSTEYESCENKVISLAQSI